MMLGAIGTNLQGLAMRLSLVASLLMGIAPGQGWVLCLEPDGRVSYEIATEASGCEGCPDGVGDSREVVLATPENGDCPCIDILIVLGSERDKLKLKRSELQLGSPALIPVETVLALEPAAAAFQARTQTPRAAQSLALIRSVVLRV